MRSTPEPESDALIAIETGLLVYQPAEQAAESQLIDEVGFGAVGLGGEARAAAARARRCSAP